MKLTTKQNASSLFSCNKPSLTSGSSNVSKMLGVKSNKSMSNLISKKSSPSITQHIKIGDVVTKVKKHEKIEHVKIKTTPVKLLAKVEIPEILANPITKKDIAVDAKKVVSDKRTMSQALFGSR